MAKRPAKRRKEASQRSLIETPPVYQTRVELPTSNILSCLTESDSAQQQRQKVEDQNILSIFQLANLASPVVKVRALGRTPRCLLANQVGLWSN